MGVPADLIDTAVQQHELEQQQAQATGPGEQGRIRGWEPNTPQRRRPTRRRWPASARRRQGGSSRVSEDAEERGACPAMNGGQPDAGAGSLQALAAGGQGDPGRCPTITIRPTGHDYALEPVDPDRGGAGVLARDAAGGAARGGRD
jgi:hypothetical protein